ncbi:MAG: hypothetical protein C5B60_06810 [Chloroflexi bacterium]|nr:MAG: hypothetical protein C5B60_06810 [Chloroflexota bacterium]
MERIGRLERLETIFGVVGGLYGITVTVAAMWLIWSTGAAPCGEPTTTCVAGVDSLTLTFLILFGLLSLGVLVAALAHGRYKRGGALGVLLLCTVVLAMETLLALLSIGVLLAPAMLAAVGSSLCALVGVFESQLPVRRVVELACGAASGMLSIATLEYLFFFPSVQYSGANFGGTFSIADFYGVERVLPAFLTFGLVAFLAAGGAASNALRSSRTGQALLIIAALVLAAAALASWFVDDTAFYLHSVGMALLPSFALTLVAVVLAVGGRSGRVPEDAA